MFFSNLFFWQGFFSGLVVMGALAFWLFKVKAAAKSPDAASNSVPAAEAMPVEKAPIFFSLEELRGWHQKLSQYISEGRPYLRPGLRLEDLARELGLKPYQVSEILNLGVGASFYDYINGFRIEEAKRRLVDPAFAHMNILGIATDSGFNSKSVFNKTFREVTGMTPSEFRVRNAATVLVEGDVPPEEATI